MTSSASPGFQLCPGSNINALLVLLGFTLLTSILLLANPGYFSHDELQKLDLVNDMGLSNYLQAYVSFPSSDSFSIPIRPFSYLVQGLVAVPANNHPLVLHLADVLMHAAVGVVLFFGACRVTHNRNLAWMIALIFLAGPNTTFAVGWSAALMDRLYTLFGLVSCLAAYNYVSREGKAGSLFVLLASAILSVTSKETGIVFPAMILGYLFVSIVYLKEKKFWVALGVWSLPSVAMLAFRAKSLLNSVAGIDSAYTVDFLRIPTNIFIYFAYPFIPNLRESHSWPYLVSQPVMVMAFGVHVALTLLLWRNFSIKVAFGYVAAYLLFLLPVISLSSTASHYLYASAVPFSVAIAALLVLDGKVNNRISRYFTLGLLAVAIVHTFTVQRYIYDTGVCSQTLIETTKSAYLSLGAPKELTIVAEKDASTHVLLRIFHDRNRLGDFSPVKINTLGWNDRHENPDELLFNKNCVVYKSSIERFSVTNWAPQTTVAGKIPNEQPDGNMGVWVKVVGDYAVGEVEVLFDNIPAEVTTKQPGLITAAITPRQLSEPGVKEVAIRRISTGEVFKVGDFIVVPVE